MISEIQIENFKSIAKLTIEPGTVTVLIGENGSGKSNILEAIAFAAAAAAGKLDDEFLYTRGIRVTEQEWMVSKFANKGYLPKDDSPIDLPITLRIRNSGGVDPLNIDISREKDVSAPFQMIWNAAPELDSKERDLEMDTAEFLEEFETLRSKLSKFVELTSDVYDDALRKAVVALRMRKKLPEIAAALRLRDFLIYSPENSALRKFEEEGAIKPLGTKGEGLLKLLSDTAASGNVEFGSELKSLLGLLGWFQDFRLPTAGDEIRGRLLIQDRFLPDDAPLFDQRSANEGFLFLLFYFTLFLSKATPQFFAIDNIDNSLNPKLCAELMRHLAELAEKSGKQVICTTHNPAILDGINLHDDKQRLYVVRRNSEGHTIVSRVKAPRPRPDGPTVKLSTAFMSGMLGGVPDHF